MTYLLLFCAVLLLPGWFLCRWFGLDQARLLLSIPVSYAGVIVFLFVGRWWGLDIDLLAYCFAGFTMIIVGLGLFVRKRVPVLADSHGHADVSLYGVLVIITLLLVVYFLAIGIHNEVPADLFRHLENAQAASHDFLDGNLRPVDHISVLSGKSGRYWHYLHGFIAHYSHAGFLEATEYATYANIFVLTFAIAVLAWYVFAGLVPNKVARAIAVLLVCFFFFVHFGVNVFSYVRYYAFAPAALNMVVYFAAIGVFMSFVNERGIPIRYLLLLLVFVFTAAMVHVQEAVFIVVIGLLMLSYVAVARRFGFAGNTLDVNDDDSSEYYYQRNGFDWMIPHGWLVILGLVVLAAGFLYSHFFLTPHTPGVDGKLVSLGEFIPPLREWYVLNPSYQFFHVVTPWGLLVYVLFFWHWKDFRGSPFIVAGMLSPLFTVFNPLFVDLFLRHTTYITLWRFCYIIPLTFVAGYLAHKAFARFRETTLVGKVGYGLMVIGLVASLFPIQVGSFTVSYSRLQTLMPVKKENSPEHWADLLDYLRSLPKREQILTDPVTGYFVSALTKHHSPRYKFFRFRYNQFNFDSYDDKPLAKFKHWLVLVNLRDGGYSKTGELSGHWPANVLEVSRYYKPQLTEHLESNPDRFRKLWETEDIEVYRILR